MAMILDKNKFYQWDLERTLEIVDNIVTEVHFKKFTDNQLYVCEVYDNNGVRVVDIPNILFTTPEKFTAYFYCNDLFTKQHTSFDIIPRPKPTDYVYTETEVKRYDTLEQEIEELNNAVNELNQKIDEIPTITVDQNYDAESKNPQSGQAVAQALEEFTPVDENQLIGRKTEEGGVIIGDDDNNKALAKDTFVNGNDNWAGYYGYRIMRLEISPDSSIADVYLYAADSGNQAYNHYSVGDIVQMHLQSHYHDRYMIIANTQGTYADLENGSSLTIKPLYGDTITDELKLASDKDYPDGSRNWLYVIGKPYGDPMKYSKGATAFGNHNTITGQGALGIGDDNIVLGKGAFAGGSDNKVGYAALANGTENKAIHNRSATLGRGLKSGRTNQTAVGEFNEVEDDALFVVGNGTSDTSRSNAFTVGADGTAKVQSKLLIADVDVGSKLYESPYMKVDELPESGDMDKIYITPEGQYIYNLKDKNVSFEDVEIWDGTKTEPKLVNGVYEITNGAELAYIVANGGQEGAYYKLTKDIYLNDINKIDWKTGVANNYTPNFWYTCYSSHGFYGSIDGNGHIIYGLYFKQNPGSYVPGAYGAGLIPFVVDGKTASITNLGVNYAYIHYEGAASAFIGDLKNNATATFSKCFVGENVCIKGGSAGAFCGRTGGSAAVSLTNCYSLASTVVAYDSHTAGIAGVPRGNSTAITVNNSFNAKGAIFSSYYTTNKREANNSYQSVAGTKSNEKVLTLDNMQGKDVFENQDKMPNLNLLPPIYIATESFPQLIVFACGWVKISTANKEYNPLLDLINYELMEDNTIKILGPKNRDDNSIVGEHIIPDYIDGYPVTVVGKRAFDHYYGLTKIILPSTIKTIEQEAFRNCGLKEVVFNEGIKIIEYCAFSNNRLEYIILPDSIIELDPSAFVANNIKTIKLGSNITQLPDLSHTAIETFTFPDNITSFGDSRFSSCNKLSKVIFGNKITYIPPSAFSHCSSLKQITIPSGVTTIEKNTFAHSGLHTITIPTSVNTIYKSAFSECPLYHYKYEGDRSQWKKINIIDDGYYSRDDIKISYNQAPATKYYVETQLNAPKAEMILTDNTTGTNYRVYITDGKLQLEVVE